MILKVNDERVNKREFNKQLKEAFKEGFNEARKTLNEVMEVHSETKSFYIFDEFDKKTGDVIGANDF